MSLLASRIRVVLVETSHPGNIGAAARAMKTMGLNRLYLVQPARFPCAEATAMASGADDLLVNAVVCETLPEALRDAGFVVGTSARPRAVSWPMMTPCECATQVIESARGGEVALVFGREHSGLTNEEVDLCHALVKIPTAPEYSSLNLAAAVQILAYEIFQAGQGTGASLIQPVESPSATQEQMERLYAHLEAAMIDVGFLNPAHPKRLQRRLRRLFNRAQLDQNEMNILRGFLAAVQVSLKKS
jgi:TrmH family RNA methyltransferase